MKMIDWNKARQEALYRMSLNESILIETILRRVSDHLEYDNGLKRYCDSGNFVLSLNKSEFVMLKKIIKAM